MTLLLICNFELENDLDTSCNFSLVFIFIAVVIVTVISDTGYPRHSPIRLSRKKKNILDQPKNSRLVNIFSTDGKKFSTGQKNSRHTRTNLEININSQRVRFASRVMNVM